MFLFYTPWIKINLRFFVFERHRKVTFVSNRLNYLFKQKLIPKIDVGEVVVRFGIIPPYQNHICIRLLIIFALDYSNAFNLASCSLTQTYEDTYIKSSISSKFQVSNRNIQLEISWDWFSFRTGICVLRSSKINEKFSYQSVFYRQWYWKFSWFNFDTDCRQSWFGNSAWWKTTK